MFAAASAACFGGLEASAALAAASGSLCGGWDVGTIWDILHEDHALSDGSASVGVGIAWNIYQDYVLGGLLGGVVGFVGAEVGDEEGAGGGDECEAEEGGGGELEFGDTHGCDNLI